MTLPYTKKFTRYTLCFPFFETFYFEFNRTYVIN